MDNVEMELVPHGVKTPVQTTKKTLNIKFAVDEANDIVLKIDNPKSNISAATLPLATLQSHYNDFVNACNASLPSSYQGYYWVTKGGAKIGELLEASIVTVTTTTDELS